MSFTMDTEFVQVTCANDDCGTLFAITAGYQGRRKQDRRNFYCPNGHTLHYPGKTAEDERDEAKAKARHLADQLQASEAEAENTRRELVRQRSRFANGVCPQCNRSFVNVRRHIATKHPDYDPSHLHDGGFKCGCNRKFDTYRGLRTHQGHAIYGAWDEARARRRHTTKV